MKPAIANLIAIVLVWTLWPAARSVAWGGGDWINPMLLQLMLTGIILAEWGYFRRKMSDCRDAGTCQTGRYGEDEAMTD